MYTNAFNDVPKVFCWLVSLGFFLKRISLLNFNMETSNFILVVVVVCVVNVASVNYRAPSAG